MRFKLNQVLRAWIVAGVAAHAGLSLAAEVEVLHWWTSGSEARAVGELKKMVQAGGDSWKDFAVAGGAGDNAMTVLKSRVVSGSAPTAAQIKGPSIQEWGAEEGLSYLDDVAKKGNWNKVLPAAIANQMKYKGQYVAAPLNVHRVNWMWINKALLEKYADSKVPQTWDELFKFAEAMKQGGIAAPIAHGGQDWQDFTVFESVVLGVGGASFYQKALVGRDQAALKSSVMMQALTVYKKLRSYVDRGSSGRDWNLATAMVIQGKSGVQFMGDWVKGEFSAAKRTVAPPSALTPEVQFLCATVPGTANSYSYNVDSFVFFRQKEPAKTAAEMRMASILMSPKFQEMFNLNKGSIPVRADASMDKFDLCAKQSHQDFLEDAAAGTLVPSISQSMALPAAIAGAIKDAVSQFWNTDSQTVAEAQAKIARAAAQVE